MTSPALARLPDTLSEPDLVALAVRGNGAAFERLMRRYNQLLFRTARSLMKDDSAAEEVVQDAYLRAWKALDQFRAESKLSTWLVRIVTNEALGRLRRHRADVIPLEAAMISSDHETQMALSDHPSHSPDQQVLREQMRELLEARIDLLPDAFRTVFMLRAVEEMSVEEVAQALDIPEATVRTRFFRARSLLREGMASEVDSTLEQVFSFDGARCDRIVAGVLTRGITEGLTTSGIDA